MVQFKNVFLGHEQRANPRAASSQQLPAPERQAQRPRGGGPRHLPPHACSRCSATGRSASTTRRKRSPGPGSCSPTSGSCPRTSCGRRSTRTDDEAESLWKRAAPTSRPAQVLRFDEKDNFWEMGDTGPAVRARRSTSTAAPTPVTSSTSPATTAPSTSAAARYIELWNLVFIQYDRQPGGALGRAEEQARRHRHGARARHRRAAAACRRTTTPISSAA